MDNAFVNPQDAWNAAFHQLEMQLDRASFETWLRGAVLLGVETDSNGDDANGKTSESGNGVFVVGVRNTYARDMLQHRLYRNVRRVLGDVYGTTVELRFEVNKPTPEAPASTPEEEMPLFRLLAQQDPVQASAPALHELVARPQRPELPESELNPRLTFDRYVAANENATIFAAAQAVAERQAYNPFFIYGGVGLGKTHLLQAIAHACKARNLRVIYIPSEVFTNDLVDSIRNRTQAMFRDKYRSADVLLVDDIQFISGKESTQEEFFHTFNALYTFNKQIVLASDRPPRDLETLEARLRSRFEGGLVMDIQPPSFETRMAILNNWASERQIVLPRHVAEMIAGRAKLNVRELEGIFNQVVAAAQIKRQPLNVGSTEEILDGYRRPREHITLAQVLDLTARHHGLTVEELVGKRRTSDINQARQIAMYLAREFTNASLPQIGDAFGGRTHSTVLHSCNKIAEDMEHDPQVRTIVKDIRARLLNQQP
ncbi:MAG: chromosomal replication initiator protein DnaA [Chloroflexi bacterium]|nr:chromosomal replication initiator protein DnaA [Chloroflexota bacterium]